ncbi:MAG: NUDIX hydrolase [Burkholderiaceae bacterium]|nr:NUDIX hydrolase [Burkholderiaceae bacterium]
MSDAHLREHSLGGQVLSQGHFLELRRDDVRLPDGSRATREYVVHPGAVAIVPLLDDGRLVLERQYRYPVGRVLLEFPAGKIDPGEDTLACARRELLEETGYHARHWARAGLVHNAAAYSTEGIEIWFARGLSAGTQRLDVGEFLELRLMTEGELEQCAASGQLTDVKTLIGLLWLQKWRAGLWPLDWVDTASAAPGIIAG